MIAGRFLMVLERVINIQQKRNRSWGNAFAGVKRFRVGGLVGKIRFFAFAAGVRMWFRFGYLL